MLLKLDGQGLSNSTLIVVTSDHGWQLGEHGEWAKYALFEGALQVPLIISPPQPARGEIFDKKSRLELGDTTDSSISPSGHRISDHVELLDLFPTISELAGVPVPVKCTGSLDKLCTEGRSLVSLMKRTISNELNTDVSGSFSISQCPRPSRSPQNDTDQPRLKSIRYMGYSLKDSESEARYSEWLQFNSTSFKTNFSHLIAKELYLNDLELVNVAYDPEWSSLAHKLSNKLRSVVDVE